MLSWPSLRRSDSARSALARRASAGTSSQGGPRRRVGLTQSSGREMDWIQSAFFLTYASVANPDGPVQRPLRIGIAALFLRADDALEQETGERPA
jgi:hypothetical protein